MVLYGLLIVKFVCLFVLGGVKFPEIRRSFPCVHKHKLLPEPMVHLLSLRRGMSVLLTILVLGMVGYASTPIAVQIYF